MRSFLLLVAIAAMTACGSPRPATTADTAKPSSTPPPSAPVREPTDEELRLGPVLTVVSSGSAPRRAIALGRAASQAVAIDVRSVVDDHFEMTGRPSPKLGPVTRNAHAVVRTKAPGDGTVGCSVEQAEAVPECSFVRSDRGAVQKITLLTTDQVTGDSDDEGDGLLGDEGWPTFLRNTLRVASIPFPAEPIGVGAEWETWERVRVDHVWTRRHARYKLLEIGEKTARVALALDEVAPSQRIDRFSELAEAAQKELATLKAQLPPGALDGGKVVLSPETKSVIADMRANEPTLRSASQRVEGELRIAYDKALPESAKLTATDVYELERPGATQGSKVTRTIVIQDAPRHACTSRR